LQFQRKYSLVIPANAGIQLLSGRATTESPLSSFPRKRESILILALLISPREELDFGLTGSAVEGRRNDGEMGGQLLCLDARLRNDDECVECFGDSREIALLHGSE